MDQPDPLQPPVATRRHTAFIFLLALAAAASLAPIGSAAPSGTGGIPRVEKAKLALQADKTAYDPGATARLTALVAIDSGWHVNSHQPTCEYLIPTVLELELPAGWSQPAVRYPPAQKKTFTFAEVPLSVYDGDVVIAADVVVPAGAPRGSVAIKARLQYQACNDSQCLPPATSISQVTVTVGGGAAGSLGAAASGTTPAGVPPLGATAAGLAPIAGHRAVATSPATATESTSTEGAVPAAAPRPAPDATAVSPRSAPSPQLAPDSAGATAPAGIAATAPLAPRPTGDAGPRPAGPRHPAGLAAMLLVALLGGLILNAMPCVLPILSLKVFGLVRAAGHGRQEVTRGALATAAGILVSFWALAGLSVAAAAAGAAVGWGVQFQRPGFVAFLVVVVTLFCLNLWGLFEIPLPPALARLGDAGAREGLAGHFGSGLFATLMATPCSAPFLGTAIGFALGQPAPVIFAIFTAVGAGLALPYLALAAAPGAARLLPRPGAWMDTLKGTMGFLLAGSAVWLLYVLAAQVSPERLALVEVGLLLIALCTWLRSRVERERYAPLGANAASAASRVAREARGVRIARTAGVGLLAVAVGVVVLAASGPSAASRVGNGSKAAGLINWVAFDRTRAESIAAGGQLVFVDVTADWCFTCKVNERLVLDTPEIATAFAAHRVLPMRADWTNRNDTIGRFLSDHGRYGIPFYLLYRPGREPYVFSELPTKTSIIAALDAAAPRAQASLR